MEASAVSGRGAGAMTSVVSWALLGLVISRPSYGYELAQRLDRLYGDVLPASTSPSHVYQALDRLRKRNLIEAMLPGSGQSGRPGAGSVGTERQPRTHYYATERGKCAHEDWLVSHVEAERRVQELWVRQLGVFADAPVEALRVVERIEAEYLRRSTAISRPRGRESESELVELLRTEQQRAMLGANIAWVRHARTHFENAAAKDSAG